MIQRRTILKLLTTSTLIGPAVVNAGQPASATTLEWSLWKGAYTEGGRVIDGPQDNVSHSEGQGYGMLLALAYDDRTEFDAMLNWALERLAVRDDALFAWRWSPGEDPAVSDTNNASDGDLLIAWATGMAAIRFQEQRYQDICMALSTALAEKCVVRDPATGRRFLLPGEVGFQHEQGPVLNPSYVIIPAFRALSSFTGIPAFQALADDGPAILADLTENGPPPDWVQMTASGPQPAEDLSFNAGYDALRVPLYLAWAGLADHPAVQRWQEVWDSFEGTGSPTVVETGTGAVLESSVDPGYQATPAIVSCLLGHGSSAMPRITLEEPYYPATLSLLARVAQREGGPGCTPA